MYIHGIPIDPNEEDITSQKFLQCELLNRFVSDLIEKYGGISFVIENKKLSKVALDVADWCSSNDNPDIQSYTTSFLSTRRGEYLRAMLEVQTGETLL